MAQRAVAAGACALLFAALLVTGCGRTRVEDLRRKTFAIDERPVLHVDLPAGDVRITAAEDRQDVAVEAAITLLGGSREELDARLADLPFRMEQEEGEIRVYVDDADIVDDALSIDVVVGLPSESDLIVHTGRGDIDARNVHGQIDLATERGMVIFRGSLTEGDHALYSSRGRIELWLQGGICARILAETSDGKIEASNFLIRGTRQPTVWDVKTYCPTGPTYNVTDDPPVTIRLRAAPGNIYLLAWSADD